MRRRQIAGMKAWAPIRADIGCSNAATKSLAPVPVGIGSAAQLDEGLFHQLLHCHHLDDRTGLGRALVFGGA
jgi:uncharacterized membrane protein